MFTKPKRLISLILVFLLTFTNTDILLASDTQTTARSSEADWTYTIPANPEDGVTVTGYKGNDAEVVVPGTLGGYPVRRIAGTAFPQTGTITSITLPKEVTEIGAIAFSYIKTLEEFTVEAENEKYFSRDGIIYCREGNVESGQNMTELFCYPPAKQQATVTIPEDVAAIGDYAFYNCTGIGDVVIGNHVTRVERQAFYNSSMKNLTLGSGLEYAGPGAFTHCCQLDTVSISGEMRLRDEWGKNPFDECTNLREISIVGTGGQYTLADGVLFGNGGKRLLAYPPMKEGNTYTVLDGVEEIADSAFYGSRYLTQVQLPQSLQEIGGGAFAGAKLLQSVTGAGQLRIIGDDAFYECRKLEIFELPDTLERIGNRAFSRCIPLSVPIEFPSCLKYFGKNVFDDCKNVTEITFLAREFQIDNDRSSIADHVVIKGYKESSAETYAKLCGKIFVDIETGGRVDYSYTEQTLLALLPADLEYGEPVHWNSVVHEYDVSNEKYVGLKNFTDNLVKDCTTDYQKMSEISEWVHNHITYQYAVMAGGTIDSVYRTFYEESPVGNCEVYAQLAAYMLYLEGIPCVLMTSDIHQWCGAYSEEDGKWYMVDASSGIMAECGAFSSVKNYENPSISFSSNGMVLEIHNGTGVELAGFHYGELSEEVTDFTIPDYIANIQEGVFDYYGIPEDFLLHGNKGTYAEKYVNNNGYECIRYQGNTFTACKTHKKKEIKDEENGTYQTVCERCGEEFENGKFLNQPKIRALTESDAGITVVWEKAPHAEKYRVYRKFCKDTGLFEWTLLGETENTTFLDDTPDVTKFGGAWYYTVQAVAGEGNGQVESSYDSDTAPYVVCKPGDMSVYSASVENGGIHLYWSGSSRRYTGVEIYRSVDGGAYEKVSTVEDVAWDWVDTTADKTKCNVYYLRAYNKAKDAIIYGEDSEPVTVADLAYALVEFSTSTFTYNGTMQTPEVTVKIGNAALTEGADYTVSVRDNINAGTVSLTVNGEGFVSGSQAKNYTIEKAAASLAAKADKTSIDTNGSTMVRPSGFWDGDCSFTSSDETVATVTEDGLVTGVSVGEVTITVTSEDTANCASGSASVKLTIIQGACSHEYKYTMTTPATCTKPETGVYTCTKCQDSYTAENGKKLGHDYKETVTAPTCTTGGYTDYLCSRCEDKYRWSYVPATGHNYDSGTVTKRLTCETDGETVYKCKSCEKTWTLTTPAMGHSYGTGHMIVKPTCQSEGVRQYECQHCSDTYTETVAKGEHEFYTQFFYPDCTTEGYYADVCSVCGLEQNRVDVFTAFGHDFSGTEPVVLKEATCTHPGMAELTCARCGLTQKESIPSLSHDYQEETIKEADCTESGEKKYTCRVCKTTKTEKIEPLGHAYVEGYKQPSCISEGGFFKKCKDCGDISWIEKEPLRAHDFVLKETIRPKTCESDGEYVYQCSHCRKQETRIEAATGHDYLPEHVEVKASCQTEGMTIKVCNNCGHIERRTLPKTKHKYSCRIVSQPTDTQPGKKLYKCTCGDYYYETYSEDQPKKNTLKVSDVTKTVKSSTQSFTLKVTQTGDGKLSYSSNNPAVTISKSGKVTIKKNFVGKVAITVKSAATEKYKAAAKKITLKVNPAPVQITKAAIQKQRLTVKWKKNAKAAGYQVQYAADKKFKSSVKTVKVKKNKVVSYKSPKLKRGKTYYVRVRTYKNGCYSAWSKVKNVKVR